MKRISSGFYPPKEFFRKYNRNDNNMKLYTRNLNHINRSAHEFYFLFSFLSLFQDEKDHGDDYETALKNQTLYFKTSQISHAVKDRSVVKSYLDKFEGEGIIKRLRQNYILINPLYCEHMFPNQTKYAKQIMENEFGNK